MEGVVRSYSSSSRHGIALMITLFFIIAITAAVGISLSQFTQAKLSRNDNGFLVQTAVILDDVMTFVRNDARINSVEDAKSMASLVQYASLIPIKSNGLEVTVRVNSAYHAPNINTLGHSKVLQEALKDYCYANQVRDVEYLLDLLRDSMDAEDGPRTNLLDTLPWMRHERIADMDHLQQILDYYVLNRRDDSVNAIAWREIVRFDEQNSTAMDLNQLSPEAWRLVAPAMIDEKVKHLVRYRGNFESYADLELDEDTQEKIEALDGRFYMPVLHIALDIRQADNKAVIEFEYEIETKKARIIKYEV